VRKIFRAEPEKFSHAAASGWRDPRLVMLGGCPQKGGGFGARVLLPRRWFRWLKESGVCGGRRFGGSCNRGKTRLGHMPKDLHSEPRIVWNNPKGP